MSASDLILDRSLNDLIELVANESSAAAAGMVASISAAMAAGLVAMSARCSREAWEQAGAAVGQAEVLRSRATALISESAEAYERAVMKLDRPSDDPAASAEQRDWQLGVALRRAGEAPLLCALIAADIGELAAEVAEHADAPSRADAVAGCVLAESSARISAHLVEINLAIAKDDQRVTRALAAAKRAARSSQHALAASTT